MAQAVALNERFMTQNVGVSDEAYKIQYAFDKECDYEINKTDDESWRQMWNRAHLKMLRMAALLAVADNCINPVIGKVHMEWSLDVVRRDIALMRTRINSGDVGVGDGSRERKLISLIARYLSQPVPVTYGIPQRMREEGIVPRKYLQTLTSKSTSFTGHKNGHHFSLDASIKSLIDSGYLVEVPKEKLLTGYEFHGRSFRVVALPQSQNEKSMYASRS